MTKLKLSPNGAHLIEQFEGFVPHPYRDSVGVWTIGYGSTRGVGPNSPNVTRAQAEARMKREVDATYGAAINALGLPLNQNQFDALVSFVYNVGPGGVASTTTVGKRLRAHDWRGAADALLAWDIAGGHVLAGLKTRRQAERTLFLKHPAAVNTDPLAHLTAGERARVKELDKLRAIAVKNRTATQRSQERNDKASLVTSRKAIYRIAQPKTHGGDGHGWDHAHRRERYHLILDRTR
jgi:lysozyme